jgi:hypothetical protein
MRARNLQAARDAASVKGKREGLLEQARQLEAAADTAERNARQVSSGVAPATCPRPGELIAFV